jgi:excinuclease ABC subunit C
VPVYIRLDPRPASPGVEVVHEPDHASGCRCFGPYLGGARVRLAASALRRVLPLAYAREAQEGSGRDMARALGVLPGDRDALVKAVTGVLERRPRALGSLQTELARRRDAAAAALAFELAASLHEEIEAVSWTFAEQKVALLDPRDLDVHGWAEGVLVRFEIRKGRLDAWTERRCPDQEAAPLVAATPAPWRAFARRNAELAADLRSVD